MFNAGGKKERAWLASDLKADDWLVPVNEDATSEIKTMIQKMRSHPLPMLLRRPNQFDIPRLREICLECKSILDSGIGFAVIDKLPIDNYDFDNIIEVYWTLGQLIGPNVAQKRDGIIVYDVIDTKKHTYMGSVDLRQV